MRIDIVALDGVFDTGLAALMDTLSTANELLASRHPDAVMFDFRLVGVGKRVKTAMGLTATVQRLDPKARPDWVVVPALNAKQPERLFSALSRPDVVKAKAHLCGYQQAGVGIAAACLGTFILADAGLLNRRQATTTWSMAPLFRQHFPQVDLDDSQMVVLSQGVATAGAAMAHLDLALWLVRQASPELASEVARFLLIDTRSSQAQYIIPDHLANADPLIGKFERWAREHLQDGFSLDEVARHLHVHPRTLQRRSQAITGKSPMAFFQDLRVRRAEQLVALGQDLERVAEQVGYADASTLRNLLRRKLKRGVREIRSGSR